MRASKKLPEVFRPINGRIYSGKRCFYCGKLLRNKSTKEHVFPKWLQEKFNLRNKTIHLLNGTTIQYSKLTVPCCHSCNTIHLSKLENRVKRFLFDAPIGIARKHSGDVLLWVMKIFLGIVYAERLLPMQRSKPKGRKIFPTEIKNALAMTHFFVRGLDLNIKFEAEGKRRDFGSIFIFNLKEHPDPETHFDFRDDPETLSVFLRLGNRGVIAVADGGALDFEIGPVVRRDGAIKLHPVQYSEIGAKVFYKASLFNRTPKYIIAHTGDAYRVIQMPLAGLSPIPVFSPWNHGMYARYLAAFLGTEVEKISSPGGALVSTYLYDKHGKRVYIPIEP